MIVYDRILNKAIPLSGIESPVILGRYIFKTDRPDIQLNECGIKNRNFIVPCNSNEGTIEINSEKSKLIFQENEMLNEDTSSLIKHTILEISEEMKAIDDFSDLQDINILLRNFDERLEISEFELLLQKKLFHIEEVCREPSYYLKREISKLNVARAKRIPVKAINYLAAHTEDWSRRRIRSVEPRKILSEIVDYDLEIYENQITSCFIDKLLIYFSNRLINEIEVIDSFIKSIEKIIESRKRINSNERVYWYKKLDRDFQKLGKAVDSIEKNKIKVAKIKDFISSLQLRLLGLLRSDLYVANKNSKNILSQKLKRTNLLDNHQHYRFTKILWDKFHKKEHIENSEKSEENQEVIRSYINYSWNLIIRSLYKIGFVKIKTVNDNSYTFLNKTIPNVSIKLVKNEDSIIEININGDIILFIPLPSTKDISKRLPKIEKNKYYLLLTSIESRNDILRVSPSDINSEELISNILFKRILNSFIDNYLFQLDSQSISKFTILKGWLKNNNSLILDTGQNGKVDFWLKRKLNSYEIKDFNNILNEQKQSLSARTDIRKNEVIKLKEIEKRLILQGNEHFCQYEICIRCSHSNPSGLKSIGERFQYRCNSRGCEVEYGYYGTNKFFKVPNGEEIRINLSKSHTELSKSVLLNAFGFENI
jgi:hypothetical protein